MTHIATVASSVTFVSELRRSVDFYRDVLGCEVRIMEPSAALLLARGGFQLYLIAKGRRAGHPSGGLGVQYLMWATDNADELERLEQALKDQGCHTETHVTDGVTFVEGRDPDGLRVTIAYPSPEKRPRSVLDPRFYS